ncbi:helix-turn-helix transcriptional regulator [Actinomadura sp. NEAU-AAG7]|uniref:helix-turn-helix transcriptional regulator n=1 Tax=Actinomadura sp. NEAU-AAG7 TaxID=2839640 RepID=UPI001BE48BBD|nr:helix-turn-helix transcriptional regulator [Actinomadura sp. NEAU-AAG7]MBT2207388.1 helix-turn-helix transcriptional regulator [Actinomadura sp. NEAU-AAG7]
MIAREGAGTDELACALSKAIDAVVPHDAARLVGTSPAARSIPSAFSFWHGYEADFGRALLRDYYAGHDPGPPDELALRPLPVALLGIGDERRHLRFRSLMSRFGAGSVLRVLLKDVRGIWGMMDLLRGQDARPFCEGDAERAARLVPELIEFLRSYVTGGRLARVAPPPPPPPPPGVIIVGADDVIRSATPQAHLWRERLEFCSRSPRWTGEVFMIGLAMQTRVHALAPHTAEPLIIGPAAAYGRWLACHGQPLGDSGDVAIVIQAATSSQMLPSFCDWYGITARERQIIGHLRDAMPPKQIARTLELSVHTVNDHLKAVFRKTGACGRDELLAALAG